MSAAHIGELVCGEHSGWTHTHGLRFRMRDMGNGVQRIEAADLLPIEQSKDEAERGEWMKLALPFPQTINDMLWACVEHLGLHDRNRKWVPTAYVRALSGQCVEALVWRACHCPGCPED
jgi:hypothetical protein